MKKLFKKVLAVLGTFLFVFAVASCDLNISEKTADKINEAYEDGDPWDYDKVCKKLGDPDEEMELYGMKVCVWYKGYDSSEDAEEAYEDGKTIKAISVIFYGDEAVEADYEELDPDDE